MPFALSFRYGENREPEVARGATASRGHLSIIFDGHLHNRAAIAATCRAAETDDAGLALRLSADSQARFPLDLTGEFALALFNGHDRTLFCARDHTGLRPFYWFDDGAAFHCATDIGWFFTLPTFRARPNEAYAAQWLANDLTTAVDTL